MAKREAENTALYQHIFNEVLKMNNVQVMCKQITVTLIILGDKNI